MDPLKQALLDQQRSQWATPPPQVPPATPPTEPAQVPPRWQRFETAQKMQDAYRNNWTPNPMLVRVLEGNK